MAGAKNVRAGHRGRVRDRFLRDGLDGFLPHEVLELLLFYAVAQKDTKTMAHNLINKMGSLHGVLSAGREELMSVEGIGDHTAAFLGKILPMARYVMEEEPFPTAYHSPALMGEYFVSYYKERQTPSLDVALLNNRFEIIRTVHLCDGTLSSPKFRIRDAVEAAYACNAASLILGCRTEKAIAFPDSEDFFLFRDVLRAFKDEGLHLAELVLVSGKQYNTLMKYLENGLQKKAVRVSLVASAQGEKRRREERFSAPMSQEILEELLLSAGGKRALSAKPRITERFTTLGSLLSMPYGTLMETTGLSAAEAVFFKLLSPVYAYTRLEEAKRSRPVFGDEETLGAFFCGIHAGRTEETVSLLLLDEKRKLLDVRLFTGGTVNTVMVVPRILAEAALQGRAHAVAMAHNHPSGNVTPSDADVQTTDLIKNAFAQIGIAFLGHFVVNEREYKLL